MSLTEYWRPGQGAMGRNLLPGLEKSEEPGEFPRAGPPDIAEIA